MSLEYFLPLAFWSHTLPHLLLPSWPRLPGLQGRFSRLWSHSTRCGAGGSASGSPPTGSPSSASSGLVALGTICAQVRSGFLSVILKSQSCHPTAPFQLSQPRAEVLTVPSNPLVTGSQQPRTQQFFPFALSDGTHCHRLGRLPSLPSLILLVRKPCWCFIEVHSGSGCTHPCTFISLCSPRAGTLSSGDCSVHLPGGPASPMLPVSLFLTEFKGVTSPWVWSVSPPKALSWLPVALRSKVKRRGTRRPTKSASYIRPRCPPVPLSLRSCHAALQHLRHVFCLECSSCCPMSTGPSRSPPSGVCFILSSP